MDACVGVRLWEKNLRKAQEWKEVVEMNMHNKWTVNAPETVEVRTI